MRHRISIAQESVISQTNDTIVTKETIFGNSIYIAYVNFTTLPIEWRNMSFFHKVDKPFVAIAGMDRYNPAPAGLHCYLLNIILEVAPEILTQRFTYMGGEVHVTL